MIAGFNLRAAPATPNGKSQQSQRYSNGFHGSVSPQEIYLVDSPHLGLSSAVAVAVPGFNFLGDALRDQFHPRTRLEMGL
jgi:hypothetical protein